MAVVVIAALLLFLVARGVIVFDHSAVRRGEGAYWNDTLYIPATGEYSEDRTIAKTEDDWQINEVEEDPGHTFIVLRSFLDQSLLVREDYVIPTSGEVTTVHWGGTEIEDDSFFEVLTNILQNAQTDVALETGEAIFERTNRQNMLPLVVGYEDCPIATEYLGYMGTIDGTWYLTTEISPDQYHPDGSPKAYTVCCYAIPEDCVSALKAVFPG